MINNNNNNNNKKIIIIVFIIQMLMRDYLIYKITMYDNDAVQQIIFKFLMKY